MSKEDLTASRRSRQRESKQYRFSIIIPVLNEAEQIISPIEHIRSQCFGRFYEIIVVDGEQVGNVNNVVFFCGATLESGVCKNYIRDE
jgi:cellulose synthase/poly-beta-1,6-N-acetylglucosamine synthase-like glycosyltransferase